MEMNNCDLGMLSLHHEIFSFACLDPEHVKELHTTWSIEPLLPSCLGRSVFLANYPSLKRSCKHFVVAKLERQCIAANPTRIRLQCVK